MKPTEINGAGDYKFDTRNTLLSAIKFEDSSDSDSVDSEYKLFTEDSAFTPALSNEDSLNNASDQELDDIKYIKTEESLIYKGDGFVVKEETEINELLIKDELDISPTVLQPRTISLSQPSTEARAPGTSVDVDATPAPSDALYVQSPSKIKVEDLRYEDDLKRLDITKSALWMETNKPDKGYKTGGRYVPNQYVKDSRQMHVRTVEKPYKCKQCGYRGSQPSHMERHMRIHVSAKPYKCKHCEYTAFLPDSLQRHVNYKHIIRKPYQCKQCDYKSDRAGHLEIHIYKHTGEKPYQCEHCEYAASSLGNLRRHLRKHTGEKPYQCEHCEYAASSRGNLRCHLRKHTGEKPYQCEKCKYMASQLSGLRKHMRKHMDEKL